MRGHADCVRFVRSFDLPVIVLGGGGYTIRNVARTWTYETGVLLGEELPTYLPFNEYFEYYGPEFKLDVPNNNMDNQNSKKYLDGILETVTEQLKNMPFAPSAAQHPIPDDLSDDDLGESDEELEARITRKLPEACLQMSSLLTVTADRTATRHVCSSIWRYTVRFRG